MDRAEEGRPGALPSWPPAAPHWTRLRGRHSSKSFSSFTGNYSLSFLYTGLSKPREGFPSFQAVAYLNDQPFFHYNSEGRRAEPLAPWSQVEGMEDWEKESALQRAREDIFMETLSDIMDHYKDREGEWTAGCGVQGLRSRGSPATVSGMEARPPKGGSGSTSGNTQTFLRASPASHTHLPACFPRPHSQGRVRTNPGTSELSLPHPRPSKAGPALCARLTPAQGCGVESEAACSASWVHVVARPVTSCSTVDTLLGCLVLLLFRP